MWYLISFVIRGIVSRLIRRPLFCLLLASVLLNHQNLFSITLLITNFIELLSQHILMDVKDVMDQIILIKTAQSLRLTNQFKLKKLSSNLTISSPIKILRPNIPAVMMMIISQKMI